MLKFNGGDVVKAGFYWNLAEWDATVVPREGGPLPGEADAKYVRLPLLVVLPLAPMMGAVYAFFLPFIGIAMVITSLVRWAGRGFRTVPPAAEAAAPAPKAAPAGAARREAEVEELRKAA